MGPSPYQKINEIWISIHLRRFVGTMGTPSSKGAARVPKERRRIK